MRETAAGMLRPGCCARSREPGALAEAWEAARLRGCAQGRMRLPPALHAPLRDQHPLAAQKAAHVHCT